jgi:polysaccharide biosynthesis transport protein
MAPINPMDIDSSQYEMSDSGSDQVSAPILLQYWQVALRWKWVILGIIISALIIGLIFTMLTTPKYSAKSRIEISRVQKNVTKVEGLDDTDASGDLEFYQTQYALLEAQSLANKK